MKDFFRILIMVLAFLLLLVTIVTEVESHMEISDMGLLLIVMVTVSVVPALARPVYFWMEAVNEPEERREELNRKRETMMLAIALLVTGVLVVRAGINFFLKM